MPDEGTLHEVRIPAQLLENATRAVENWIDLQRQVHPDSVDGWLLLRDLRRAACLAGAKR